MGIRTFRRSRLQQAASLIARSGLVATLAVLCLAVSLRAAEAGGVAVVPTVGGLGDPEVVDFEGNAGFSAQDLRAGLGAWPGFLKAAHPNAPRSEYLAAVSAALERGYRASGFPDVTVTAALSPSGDRVVARIQEGRRYRLGEIRVEGAGEVPPTDLVGALTKSRPPADPLLRAARKSETERQRRKAVEDADRTLDGLAAETGLPKVKFPELPQPFISLGDVGGEDPTPPCFRAGEPASFVDSYLERVQSAVAAFLLERGHALAKVHASLEPDPASGLAHLRLHVEEGPSAVIGTVSVTGKPHSSAEAIVKLTGLAPGARADKAAMDRARLALWNSGRFFAFSLDAQPRDPPSAEIDITIDVNENPGLPTVDQPLPEELAAAVRFAQWMTAQARHRDLLLTVDAGEGRRVTLAVAMGKAAAIAEDGAGAFLGFEMELENARLLAANEGKAAEYNWATSGDPLTFRMTYEATDNPSPHGILDLALGYGGAGKGSQHSGERPVNIVIVLTPAAVCADLMEGIREEIRREGSDWVLHKKGKDGTEYTARFRWETGELVQLGLKPSRLSGADNFPLGFAVSLQAEAELKRIVSRLESARALLPKAGAPRAFMSDVLLDSQIVWDLISGSLPEAARNPVRLRHGARLVERLAGGILGAIRDSDESDTEGEGFFVPSDPGVLEQPSLIAQMLGAGIYDLLRKSWPAGTWPPKLAREYFYILSGQTTYTDQVMEELASDPQMGPLGSLVAADLLRGRSPAWAWRFARRAVDHGSAEEFGRDWRLILGRSSWLGTAAQETLDILSGLSADEAAVLAAGLPDPQRALLTDALADLRRRDGRPLLDVAGPYADLWWQRHVQPGLEARVARMFDGGDAVDGALVAATASGFPVSRRLLQLWRTAPASFAWFPRVAASSGGRPDDEALESLVLVSLVERDFLMRGWFVKEEYLDQLLGDWVARATGGDRLAFEALLAHDGMTAADLREALRAREIFAYMVEPILKALPAPAPEEIERAVGGGAPAGEAAHVRMVSVEKRQGDVQTRRALAEGIRAEALKRGTLEGSCPDGGTRAPEAVTCLELESVSRGDLRKELDAAVFALKPGDVSEVVDAGSAFVVLQLVNVGPARPTEEERRQAEQQLQSRRIEEAMTDLLRRLRAAAVVRVIPDPAATATNAAHAPSTTRFEFEALKVAAAEGTRVTTDRSGLDAGRWSGGAQAWCESAENGWAEWEFEVPVEGDYSLELLATRGPRCAQVQAALDGENLGPPVELAALALQPSGPRPLGRLRLTRGRHVFRATVAGRQPWGTGYDFGLDAIDLVPAAWLP